jgi:hypothetical protein
VRRRTRPSSYRQLRPVLDRRFASGATDRPNAAHAQADRHAPWGTPSRSAVPELRIIEDDLCPRCRGNRALPGALPLLCSHSTGAARGRGQAGIHESAPVGACRRPCLRGGKGGGLRGERNGAYRTGRYTVEGKAGRQQLRRLVRELAIRMRRETVEHSFGTMKGRRGRTHLFFQPVALRNAAMYFRMRAALTPRSPRPWRLCDRMSIRLLVPSSVTRITISSVKPNQKLA